MITIGREYEIRDTDHRYWGDVRFEAIRGSTVHGHMQPEPDFEEVRSLFMQHELLMSTPGNMEDVAVKESSRTIASLCVILQDKVTRESQGAGLVFVSKTLLFSCDAPAVMGDAR